MAKGIREPDSSSGVSDQQSVGSSPSLARCVVAERKREPESSSGVSVQQSVSLSPGLDMVYGGQAYKSTGIKLWYF